MGKKYISIVIMLLCSVFCFSAVPNWLINLEKEFPTGKYIRATGEGDSEISAKQTALAELSAYFSASIESKTYANSSKSQKDSKYSSNSSIEQDIAVLTNSEVFAVHYTQSYYNKKQKKYSVCAYIDRAEAFNIISQKMSFYKQYLSQKTKLAKRENEDFRKIMILSDALSIENETNALYEYAVVIDSQKAQNFDNFISQVNETKITLFGLKQKNPVSVFSNGDYSEQIKSIISEILTENGFVISRNADYKISSNSSFSISEQITEQNEIFSCKPIVSVLVEGKSGTISSSVLSTEKISSYNKQTLTRMAMAKTEDLLRDELIQNCLK